MRTSTLALRARPLVAGAFLLGATMPTAAQQDAAEVVKLDKVEVTGSRIARIDAETALPVQVIDREEILRGNWTTASELMAHISANIEPMNVQRSILNATNPGLESANLRGLGGGNTLVLLNGRRLSNYAFLSDSANLNVIPMSAIERVEILKDGASSIYGTDAVAGVINFITRKDFTGVEATAQSALTERAGGDHYQGNVTAGWGSLATDRVNAFASLDWQKDTALASRDRGFAATGYRPEEGLDSRSLASIPANIRAGPGQYLSPGFATGCAPPVSTPAATIGPNNGELCLFDPASVTTLLPEVTRLTALGRATWQLAPDHQLFAEYVYARNQLVLTATPTPATRTTLAPVRLLYPVGGPYYPTEFAAANDLSGPLEVYYRTLPLGPRTDDVTTVAQRLVVGAQGTVGDWTYGAGYNHSVNTSEDVFSSGFVLKSLFVPAFATGLINPFGESGQAGLDLLASTQFKGPVRTAKGTTDQFDAQATRDFGALPGGPIGVALGGEWRREKLTDSPAPILDTNDILGNNSAINPQSAGRTVGAAFIEFVFPLTKTFEIDASARYDHYSDFGGTTNPKVAARWQPTRSLLLRGAWGTGFKAPSLPDLFTPQFGSIESGITDPKRCPVTHSPDDCGFGEYEVVSGGNPKLQPETSNQYTAGVIWDPVPGLSFGVEWWKIEKKNLVITFGPDELVQAEDTYGAGQVIRGPVDPNYPTLPGPIQTINAWNLNSGGLSTDGVDVTVTARTPATEYGRFQFSLVGTYVHDFTLFLPGVAPFHDAGSASVDGAIPRWRHYAQLNWQYGPWGATLAQTFQSGMTDGNPTPQGETRRVGTYSLWSLQGVYSGLRNTSIALGVLNLFDTDPPFTNSTGVGYNKGYADVRGRTYYARLTYAFK